MSGIDDAVALSHLSYGVGDTCVVMIPPNPCDLTYWESQQARFSAWHRTITIDPPGYGFSPAMPEGASLEDVARWIWSVVDAQHRGRVVVMGVSMGSTLALHMRRQRPDRVAGLVLSGCSYRPVKTFAVRRAEGYRHHGIEYRSTHLRDGFSEAFLATPDGDRRLRHALERDHLVDVESVIRLFEAHAEPDPESMFDIPGPVLIISGTEDYAHDGARALAARMPAARFEAVSGSGHACSIEMPDMFDRLALEFVETLSARGG